MIRKNQKSIHDKIHVLTTMVIPILLCSHEISTKKGGIKISRSLFTDEIDRLKHFFIPLFSEYK